MSLKIQFGSGGHQLPGWLNTDLPDVDIRKPLPYGDNSAAFLYASHVVEHVTHQEAWGFFEECFRVLVSGGVLRVAIPDVFKIWCVCTEEYGQAVKAGGFGDGSRSDAVKAAVFCHGHQAAWTQQTLLAFMAAVGFTGITTQPIGVSMFPELRGVEGHGKVVGEAVAEVETICVEGMKP